MTEQRHRDPENLIRQMAAESMARDDATGWWERLYEAAEQGAAELPWARGGPHPALAAWGEREAVHGDGRRAVVVGAGTGVDAEYLATLGFATTAFDISATAVAAARRRFPDSEVDYRQADLLALPDAWQRAFDLVVESLTVQALPPQLRAEATAGVRSLVAAGGTLLVIAVATDTPCPPDHAGPPWPLTRADIDAFAVDGLRPVNVERLAEPDRPAGRWRVEFRRDAERE
jgi:hypothetical protein